MNMTRIIHDHTGQTIAIPAELAYANEDLTLQIERIGDELRIWSSSSHLAGLLAVFTSFPPDFLIEGRGDQTESKRTF
ncbi:AbrB family transcriptional regulator [Cupriavidus oxalaticus]|uniref:AbrB family transcriptional regulator n=1 Tax=Cupriavidus oxalaticus TaxID=96344 RepID=A0A5P3VEY8_9BURK|nr:AbrB family transcriptional regulator [Cupriavidus oxalaticus]QEZ44508.1 AbrB family transcriptional regulator [Cupriavidus oxalaticus]